MTLLGLRPRSKSDAGSACKPRKEPRWLKLELHALVFAPRRPLLPKLAGHATPTEPGPAAYAAPRLAPRLPDELLHDIFGYLDVDAYQALSLVNRGTYAALRAPGVERTIWRNTVGDPAPLAPPTSDATQAHDATEERTARASIRRELTLTRSLRDAGPMSFAMPLPLGNGRSSCLLDDDGSSLFWLEMSRYTRLDLVDVARGPRRGEACQTLPTHGPWQGFRHLPGPPGSSVGPPSGMVFGQLLGERSALLHHPTGPEAYLATLQPTRAGLVASAPLPLDAAVTQQLAQHNFLGLRERGFLPASWKFGPLVGHTPERGWHLFAPTTGELALRLAPEHHPLATPSMGAQVGWMLAQDLRTALCFADQAQRACLLRLDPSGLAGPKLLADYPSVQDAGLSHDGRWAFVYRPAVYDGLEFVPLAPGAGGGFRFPLDYATWQMRWSPRGDALVTVGRSGNVVRSYGFDAEQKTLHLRYASRPHGRDDYPGQLLVAASGRRAALVFADADDPFFASEYVVVHGLLP